MFVDIRFCCVYVVTVFYGIFKHAIFETVWKFCKNQLCKKRWLM